MMLFLGSRSSIDLLVTLVGVTIPWRVLLMQIRPTTTEQWISDHQH